MAGLGRLPDDYMEERPQGLVSQRGDAEDRLKLGTLHTTPVKQDWTWVLDRS